MKYFMFYDVVHLFMFSGFCFETIIYLFLVATKTVGGGLYGGNVMAL